MGARYSGHLRELLRPLGVYDLSPESLSGSELEALGAGLDALSALSTAQGEGLDRLEALFARTPVHYTTELRRGAIAALLRIGGDSFTLSAINSAISGCGINALVEEKDQVGYVRVIFPDVVGIPDGIDQIKEIVLDRLFFAFYGLLMLWSFLFDGRIDMNSSFIKRIILCGILNFEIDFPVLGSDGYRWTTRHQSFKSLAIP